MDLKEIFNLEKQTKFNTHNIYLKLISITDAVFINELFQCQDVKRYFIIGENYQNNLNLFVEHLILKFASQQGFDFIIYDLLDNQVGLITCDFKRNDGNLIGNVSYAIHLNYRNKGYAKEALRFICDITCQSQLYALKLDIQIDNTASSCIAEKLDFIVNKQIALLDPNIPDTGLRFAWYRECNKDLPLRLKFANNAINCYKEKNYFKAIDLFKEALRHDNPINSKQTDAQVYSNLGMALSATKQYKEAYNCLMNSFNLGLRNDLLLKEIRWIENNVWNYLG